MRMSAESLDDSLSRIGLKPYRVEHGTAHFDVSASDFDDLPGQVADALAFLSLHAADIRSMMNAPGATGVLDFAVERGDAGFQFSTFPANLVREAGALGLALEVSHYPAGVKRDAVA